MGGGRGWRDKKGEAEAGGMNRLLVIKSPGGTTSYYQAQAIAAAVETSGEGVEGWRAND